MNRFTHCRFNSSDRNRSYSEPIPAQRSTRPFQNEILRTGSMEAVRAFVSHGFGIAILSDMAFRPWSLEGKRIDAKELKTQIPNMDVSMLRSKTQGRSVKTQAFIDFRRYTR